MHVSKNEFAALSTAVAIVLSGWVAPSARAGCNMIPDASQRFGGTQQGKLIMDTIPADLGHRGTFGRIDRAITRH